MGRKQKLHSKITDEVWLSGSRGLQASPSHYQQNERRMYFVTQSSFQCLLVRGGMECSGRIKFGVQLQPVGKFMAHNEAGEPSIRALVNQVVATLPIDIDRAQLLRKFYR